MRRYIEPKRLDAVELWEPYVDDIVRSIYDSVMIGDVCELSDKVLSSYDLVFMGDVIEHIEKEKALDLLDRIPGYVIICTPRDYFESVSYPHTEKHISHWQASDFGDRVDRNDTNMHSSIGAVLVRLNKK